MGPGFFLPRGSGAYFPPDCRFTAAGALSAVLRARRYSRANVCGKPAPVPAPFLKSRRGPGLWAPAFSIPAQAEGVPFPTYFLSAGGLGYGPRLFHGQKGALAEISRGAAAGARSAPGGAPWGPSPSQAGRDAGIPARCEAPPPLRRNFCKPAFWAAGEPPLYAGKPFG